MHREAFADSLLDFCNRSVTPFHATANVAARLEAAGFTQVREGEAWRLEKGGRYFLVRNRSAVIAFAIGRGDPADDGFRIIGAHTDSPTFTAKPGPCIITADGYIKLNTEAYGGAILSTWLDRPLSVAGRAVIRKGDWLEERLFDCGRPVAVIPNLAIHLNRGANDGYAYNKQVDMLPLIGRAKGVDDPGGWLASAIAAEVNSGPEALVDYDAFLYEAAPGCRMGDLLSASRQDNLTMVFAALDGIIHSGSAATKVAAFFDNEEVGSATAPGADSDFLGGVLMRLVRALGGDESAYLQACANSAAISADAAHAVHPNHPDKHDPTNRPVLGGGPVIKYSAAQKYATTGVTAAWFAQVCDEAGVPLQRFVNRSDIAGGSTIGPAMSRRTGIATVDVGAPLLAMHSIRELGHVDDAVYSAKAFRAFYDMATFRS
ncbi:MAG: M18 family aminopeptidase [Planctomycetaceae bacterium]|nr:M18 family aminopeptidase [Planctomycetaceae bacterium]